MSVRKRTWTNKDGTTSTRYIYDYFVGGIRKRKSFDHKPTIKELAELEDTVNKNPYFKDALNDFINSCSLHCKESSIETYRNYVKGWLKPLFIYRVKNFRIVDAERFILSIKDKYSPATINFIITLLRGLYKYLIKNKIVSENPFKEIKKIPIKRDKVKAFTDTQIDCFIKYAKEKPFWVFVFFMTLLHQGIRISECVAIEWDDIDFKKKTMTINKQYYRKKITSTKNYETRTIDIPDVLLALLKELYKNRTSKLVFNSPFKNGEHICIQSLRAYHFKNIIREMEEDLDEDLEGMTPHCLRHTHATYLLRNGIPIIAVSKRLGHRNCNTTLSVYNHCMPLDNVKIINLLNLIDMSQNMAQ